MAARLVDEFDGAANCRPQPGTTTASDGMGNRTAYRLGTVPGQALKASRMFPIGARTLALPKLPREVQEKVRAMITPKALATLSVPAQSLWAETKSLA